MTAQPISLLPLATRYLLLTMVLPMALPNGLHARPNGVLAFLAEGEPDAEASAALAWARERHDVVVVRPTGGGEFVDGELRPRPLGEFAALWWRCQMRSMHEMGPWHSDFTKEPTLRAVTDYLASGGGLYLSGSGARYLNYLGLEPYYVNMDWCSAANHVDCGYEVITKDHPVFRGLPDPLTIERMARDESGTHGFSVGARQNHPLASLGAIGEDHRSRGRARQGLLRHHARALEPGHRAIVAVSCWRTPHRTIWTDG